METLQDLVNSLEAKQGYAKSWRDATGSIQKESFSEYYKKIIDLSKGFMHLGMTQGDHVMHIADNNPNWVAISLALYNFGAVNVPRGADAQLDELKYTMNHSDAKFLLVKDQKTYDRIKRDIPKAVKEVVLLDDAGLNPISQVRTAGNNSSISIPNVFEDDVLVIDYTSGTSGKPKGVMLSHKNVVSNFTMLVDDISIYDSDVWMSFLPDWHVFQQIAEYGSLYTGGEMHHTTLHTLADDLQDIKPTIFPVVPLILEKYYSFAVKGMHDKAEEMKTIPKVALKTLLKTGIVPKYYVPSAVKEAIVQKLGGNVRLLVSGGAPLPDYVDDFFWKIGLPIYEGLGMTETAPIISARRPGEEKASMYTVGRPLSNVKIKIINPDALEKDDFGEWNLDTVKEVPRGKAGELLVKGPNVMIGYYKDEEATKEVFLGDYLRTGDRARLVDTEFIEVDGRYKNTLIGPNGENVDPVSLENKLRKNDSVVHSVVFNPSGSKHIFALIDPNLDWLKEYCEKKGVEYHSVKDVLQLPEVQNVYKKLLKAYNASANQIHKIKDFILLDTPLGNEELTNKKEPRRTVIEKTRAQTIDNYLASKK